MTLHEPESTTPPSRGGISAGTALWLGLLGALVILVLLHIPLFGAEIPPRMELIFQLRSLMGRFTDASSRWIDALFSPVLALLLLYMVGQPVLRLRRLQKPAPEAETATSPQAGAAEPPEGAADRTPSRPSTDERGSGPEPSPSDELHLEEAQIREMARVGERPWDPAMATPGGARAVLDLVAGMSPGRSGQERGAAAATTDVAAAALGAAATTSHSAAREHAAPWEEAMEQEEIARAGDEPRRPAEVYTPTSLYTSSTFTAEQDDPDEEER